MTDKREIDSTLLGVLSLDPFFGTTSASRAAMFSSHIGQAPVMINTEPRRVMTGVEPHFGEHTFGITIPEDITVLEVIRKFPTGMGLDSVRHNPVTTVIYEEFNSPVKRIGVLHISEYNKLHVDFGYRYKFNEDVISRITPGANIAKGERIATPYSVKDNGLYSFGVNAEVAFMSDPGCIEDGFVISESLSDRMGITAYNHYTANVGKKAVLLNLYGNANHYKPFPDIGDVIREDGLVMCARDATNFSVPSLTQRSLRTPDMSFDNCVWGRPGARVIDIRVWRDTELPSGTQVPLGMEKQLLKYYDYEVIYYRRIMEIYNRLLHRRGKGLVTTPEFNQLAVEALIFLPMTKGKRKLTRMYRLEMLDEYRVEIVTEKELKPTLGYKMTDLFGGKGVICEIRKDEDMPVSESGVRADAIIYGGSTMKRSNFGRLYEHYYNAASRDLLLRLRKHCGLSPFGRPDSKALNRVMANMELVDYCWDTLCRYFSLFAPRHLELIQGEKHEYVRSVLENAEQAKEGITVFLPVDNPVNILDTVRAIENSEFKPERGGVTYRNNQGELITTETPILLGCLQLILLEKIAESWSGVASSKTQQFGLPSKSNNDDATRTPGRENPIRVTGESETRSLISTVGAAATNEILDLTNNPKAHGAAVQSLLLADNPALLAKAVDRNEIPYGGARNIELINHLLRCRGIKFIHSQ